MQSVRPKYPSPIGVPIFCHILGVPWVPLYFVCGPPVRDDVQLMAANPKLFFNFFSDSSEKNIILYRTVEKHLGATLVKFCSISYRTSRYLFCSSVPY